MKPTGEWTTVSGGGSARSRTVTGLTNGTEYGFQVRAVNSIGEGPASEDTATPGRAPTMPTGLTAGVESETITVMWGMPADTGGSAISPAIRGELSGCLVASGSVGQLDDGGRRRECHQPHHDMGLTNGIGYEIAVRAVNGIDPGDCRHRWRRRPWRRIDFAHFANGQAGGVTNHLRHRVGERGDLDGDPGHLLLQPEGRDDSRRFGGGCMMGDLEDMAGDGPWPFPWGSGRGEMTISTNGEGSLVTRIGEECSPAAAWAAYCASTSRSVGVAGVGASEPVNDAIFPVSPHGEAESTPGPRSATSVPRTHGR